MDNKPQPVPSWTEVIAGRDAEIKRLRAVVGRAAETLELYNLTALARKFRAELAKEKTAVPQSRDELRAEFPGGDTEALAYLETFGIRDEGGLFTVANNDEWPDRVWKALEYMRDEWDYGIRLLPESIHDN